mmetsp:Transcript_36870/g.73522  ORF Transcript_36870/g.73522 Transcript_36870/m.73522 type:complete len:240 (+) Transcript_36870:1903-2622(+)
MAPSTICPRATTPSPTARKRRRSLSSAGSSGSSSDRPSSASFSLSSSFTYASARRSSTPSTGCIVIGSAAFSWLPESPSPRSTSELGWARRPGRSPSWSSARSSTSSACSSQLGATPRPSTSTQRDAVECSTSCATSFSSPSLGTSCRGYGPRPLPTCCPLGRTSTSTSLSFASSRWPAAGTSPATIMTTGGTARSGRGTASSIRRGPTGRASRATSSSCSCSSCSSRPSRRSAGTSSS